MIRAKVRTYYGLFGPYLRVKAGSLVRLSFGGGRCDEWAYATR